MQFSHSRVFLLQDGIKPYKMLVKALNFKGFEQLGQVRMDVSPTKVLIIKCEKLIIGLN